MISAGKPPIVAWYGTCRIHNSLKMLHDARRIKLLPPLSGFSHSVAEIRQHIDIAEGRLPLPDRDALLPLGYVASSRRGLETREQLAASLAPADIVFIEISSLKTYMRGDYYGQSNRISEYCNVPANIVDEYLLKNDATRVPTDVLPKLNEFTAQIHDIEASREALERIIADLAPRKVILVNHFLIEDKNHEKFISRVKLRDLLEEVAAKMGPEIVHFDPTPTLRAHNWPLLDYGHYEEDFKPILAEIYANLLGVPNTH